MGHLILVSQFVSQDHVLMLRGEQVGSCLQGVASCPDVAFPEHRSGPRGATGATGSYTSQRDTGPIQKSKGVFARERERVILPVAGLSPYQTLIRVRMEKERQREHICKVGCPAMYCI